MPTIEWPAETKIFLYGSIFPTYGNPSGEQGRNPTQISWPLKSCKVYSGKYWMIDFFKAVIFAGVIDLSNPTTSIVPANRNSFAIGVIATFFSANKRLTRGVFEGFLSVKLYPLPA